MQTKINKTVLEDGQKVFEATCPHDSTIKPRLPRKEKSNETETISESTSTVDEVSSESTEE